jgi:site-specific DNA-methyltransferase (adenine-specific)
MEKQTIENGTLYLGDCAEVLKTINDKSIDLTITSPPYDNLRAYNGYSFDFESIAKQLFRITKDGGVVVWVVGDATIDGSETGTSFKQALYFKEIGFNLHDTMIWEKTAIFPHHTNAKRYKQQFEYMFVFSKGLINTHNPICDVENKSQGKTINIKCKIKTENNGKYNGRTKTINASKFRMRSNIWKESQSGFKGHPAPFPEKLVKDHVISWSNSNDVVLDCFLGSGTTGKVCRELGRKFIGIEISKEYFDIAYKRIEDTKIQERLF